MLYALGYTNYNICFNFIDYFLKILLVSFILSFITYIISMILCNKFVVTDNTVLNSLFKIDNNYLFLIPIIIIVLVILSILYIITMFRIKLNSKKGIEI